MIKDEISITGRVQMHDDTPPTPARGDDPTAPSRGAMPSMWRRLAASLVYDSRHASPAPGVRAVGFRSMPHAWRRWVGRATPRPAPTAPPSR